LTDKIEAAATDYIRRIDEMGGALQAIEAGFVQGEIQRSAFDYQRAVESGERVIVGVNRFQVTEARKIPIFRVNPEIEREQVLRVRALRSERDSVAWKRSIERLEAAARSSENLMPRIMAAAEAMATVGEISDTLRGVFGEYRDVG
jgi:methylmalonyl-CoA mutase, N-terminal domain